MKILFHKDLCSREFGSAVFNVPELLAWAKEKGFHLATEPPLDGYDFAQAEYVLSLIANSLFYNAAEGDAAADVATQPALAQHPAAETAPEWLAGAEAARQWRTEFSKAIAKGELVLRDRRSLMPVTADALKGEAVTTTKPTTRRPGARGGWETENPSGDVKAKAGTNKKKWGDAELKALWKESTMPGVTQASLATKHGVTPQRISRLLKDAQEKFSTMRSRSGVKNSFGQLITKT